MDAIEKAIRGAFERGDPENPAYRAKVYHSIAAALERAIAAKTSMPPELADRRRLGLQATIEEVESEFRPAEPAPEPRAYSPDDAFEPVVDAVDFEADWHASAPAVASVDGLDSPSLLPDPVEIREPVGALARSPRGRPLTAALIAAAFLVLVGIAVWLATASGVLTSNAVSVTPADDPPQANAADTSLTGSKIEKPASQTAGAPANWLTVFSPADPTTVRTPSQASAEIATAGDRPVMRVRSGATGSAVLFDVGEGLLEQLRGKKAVFDITAKSEEGKPTQISVICNFGALGDCGRKRYAVGVDPGESLFEIDMPKASPTSGGTIAIVSDVDNAGKAVEIFAIRVSTSGN